MDELKISAALESDEEKSLNSELSSATAAEEKAESVSRFAAKDFDGKTIGISVVALLGLLILAVGGFGVVDWLGDTITGAATGIDIDSELEILHIENRAGALDETEGYLYNDFSFVSYDDLWWTEIVVYYTDPPTLLIIPLHYSPNELEEVEFSGSLDSEFNDGSDVYIAIDPTVTNKYYSLALSEISFNLVKGIGRKPIGSCTEENTACEGRDIISCDNNPEGYPVLELVFDESVEVATVEFDGMCMRISGAEEEIVKAADRLLLWWYQVMS